MKTSARTQQDRRPVTTQRMISARPSVKAWASLSVGAAMSFALTHPAAAQGRVDAQYEATLSGIPVGKGAWTIEIGDDQFSASAFGGTTGLLKAFSGGRGTGASAG